MPTRTPRGDYTSLLFGPDMHRGDTEPIYEGSLEIARIEYRSAVSRSHKTTAHTPQLGNAIETPAVIELPSQEELLSLPVRVDNRLRRQIMSAVFKTRKHQLPEITGGNIALVNEVSALQEATDALARLTADSSAKVFETAFNIIKFRGALRLCDSGAHMDTFKKEQEYLDIRLYALLEHETTPNAINKAFAMTAERLYRQNPAVFNAGGPLLGLFVHAWDFYAGGLRQFLSLLSQVNTCGCATDISPAAEATIHTYVPRPTGARAIALSRQGPPTIGSLCKTFFEGHAGSTCTDCGNAKQVRQIVHLGLPLNLMVEWADDGKSAAQSIETACSCLEFPYLDTQGVTRSAIFKVKALVLGNSTQSVPFIVRPRWPRGYFKASCLISNETQGNVQPVADVTKEPLLENFTLEAVLVGRNPVQDDIRDAWENLARETRLSVASAARRRAQGGPKETSDP